MQHGINKKNKRCGDFFLFTLSFCNAIGLAFVKLRATDDVNDNLFYFCFSFVCSRVIIFV